MYVACPRCHQNNYATATQCAYCGSPLAPTGQTPGFAQTNAPGFSAGSTGPGAGDTSGAASGQPQIGSLIDRKYRVERVLGEGGMGVVYVAHDINADQKVVIKSIRPEFANRGDFRERTLAEGKALAKIDHQNVVRFNSIVNSAETNELYIVMQFIDGESLDRTLEKANASGQKLPVTEVTASSRWPSMASVPPTKRA
jgi:serine/threonine protein kinase